MCMSICLKVCICIMPTPGACGGQKGLSDARGTGAMDSCELLCAAEIRTWVLYKSRPVHLTAEPSLQSSFLI